MSASAGPIRPNLASQAVLIVNSYLLSSRTPVVEAPLAFEQNPVLAASQSISIMTLSAHNHNRIQEHTEARSQLSGDTRDFEQHSGLSFANLCNLNAEGDLCQREGRDADISSQGIHLEDGCDWHPGKVDGLALQNFYGVCKHSCVVRNARCKAKIKDAPSSDFGFSTDRI